MALPHIVQKEETRFRRYYTNIMPAMKKPHVRASTSAVFSFLSVSLFLWYAVRPTANTIIHLKREIQDKTVLNQQMESKISSLIEAQASYESVKDLLPILEDGLPHVPDAVRFARQIRTIADISQASISAIQIPQVPITTNEATPGANTGTQNPLQEYTVSVVVTGSYPAITSVLSHLHTLRRITHIEQLTIQQGKSIQTPGDTLQLSLQLKTYYSLQ